MEAPRHTQLDVQSIVARSFTLPERLAAVRRQHTGSRIGDEQADAVARRRMEDWSRRLTRDGRSHLSDRLASAKASLSSAVTACSPAFQIGEPAPAWLAPVVEGVERLADGQVDLSARASGTPFADVLTPFVPGAKSALAQHGHDVLAEWKRLPDTGREALRAHLIRRLSAVSRWCLYSRFDAMRTAELQAACYDRFVETSQLWAYGFFNTYAGLARPVGMVMTHWAACTAELLRRWSQDRLEICRFLGAPTDTTISDFEAFPSDPHNFGRGVVIVRLSSGQRIVYKPTSGRLSSLWADAVALTIGGASPEPDVLDRGDYSWHRHFAPCRSLIDGDREDVRRLGGLLAVAVALGATDLHYENFVVAATGPLLVDHETVLSPGRKVPGQLSAAERAAVAASFASVLATGAMPYWAPGPSGEIWNANVFGWQQGGTEDGVFPFIADANTDRMNVSTKHSERNGANGRLALDVALRTRSREMGIGFSQGWSAVVGARGQLTELIAGCRGATARVMVRDTRFYAELLGQSYMPRYCHDTLDRSLLFEHLHRAILGVGPTSDRWRLCRSEHDALTRCDIPAFVVQVDGVHAREVAASTSSFRLRAQSPAAHAARKLERLTPADAGRQVALIHSSFDAAAWPGISTHEVRLTSVRATRRKGWGARYALAADLFALLSRHVFISRTDGSIALMGASLDETGKGQRVGVCAATDTYAGIAGLGLLAAALDRCTPRRRFRDTALRVADTLSISATPDFNARRGPRFGAFAGAPGVALILYKLGTLLDAPVYVDLAADLMAHHSDVPADCDLDVMSGVAGATLVTSAIARSSPGRALRLRAALDNSGNALRSRAGTSVDGTDCWWATMGKPEGVSGFSHGIAGIAAALARLQTDSSDSYRDLAAMALAREGNLYSPSGGGWPTTNGNGTDPVVTNVWCYGAAGVLLALGEAARAGISPPAGMITLAVDGARGATPSSDGLCHGETGVALSLLRSAGLLGDDQLAIDGRRRLDSLARRVSSTNHLRLEPVETLEHSGGLMCGASGVAFAMVAPETGTDAIDLIGIE
jgi:type 2 lantibiotic biosynthesis protein LanM